MITSTMSRGLGESAHAPEHSRPLRRQISPSASEFRFAEEMAMAGISLAPGLALLDRLDKLEATGNLHHLKCLDQANLPSH